MTAHSTLAALTQAVASDMASNGLSRATQVAMRCLEETPECVFDLVELIAKEHRKKRSRADMMGAYALLLAHALEWLRYGVERDAAGSIAVVERLRMTLLDLGETDRIGAPILLLVLNQFAAAKLDIGDALRQLMQRLMATDADALDALRPGEDAADPGSLADLVEHDAFAIHTLLDQSAEALPEDLRAGLVIGLLREKEPAMREAAVGFLLNGSSLVRSKLTKQIGSAAQRGLVSPIMLRRMISVRNWLPAADQPTLDKAITACRRQDVACAPWPQPRAIEVLASEVDGSGAQTVLAVARDGRKRTLAGLLVKQGVGVRDAWVRRSVTKAELRGLLDEVKGEIGIAPSSIDHAAIVTRHFLAINAESGAMPPFGVLDFAETVGLADLNPDPWSPERLAASLCDAMDPARLSQEAVAETMRDSADWAEEHPMVASWFEPDLGEALGSRRAPRDKQRAVLLLGSLQSHRRRWAEIAAWTSLGLKYRTGDNDWEGFAVLARELLGHRPLDEIGIMKLIADTSLSVHSMQHLVGAAHPA